MKINKKRMTWDSYFLEMTNLVASRSTCLRRKIGAVIVKDNHVISTGYNGACKGHVDCLTLGCLRDELAIASGTKHEICRAVHAEQNAIIQAATQNSNIDGGTLYCTASPCFICAKMIVNAGIKRIYIIEKYPDNRYVDLFKESNIEIFYLSEIQPA